MPRDEKGRDMTGLVLKDIRKAYGQVKVLHGIDLEIAEGEFVVFVGPSGCGKSTLLRMIAGLEEISGGDMFIDGNRVNEVPPFQARHCHGLPVLRALSAHDRLRHMALACVLRGKNKQEIDRRVRAAADILQLTQYLERLPRRSQAGSVSVLPLAAPSAAIQGVPLR